MQLKVLFFVGSKANNGVMSCCLLLAVLLKQQLFLWYLRLTSWSIRQLLCFSSLICDALLVAALKISQQYFKKSEWLFTSYDFEGQGCDRDWRRWRSRYGYNKETGCQRKQGRFSRKTQREANKNNFRDR